MNIFYNNSPVTDGDGLSVCCVKMSERCENAKKMSNVKEVKQLDYGGGSQKLCVT